MTTLYKFDGIVRPRFIETGTAEGNTLIEAAQVFEECLSIEQSEKMFTAARLKFKDMPHVKLFRGNSPGILRQIIDPKIPTTFWLDAHYYGQAVTLCADGGQCPLLGELRAITSFNWETKPIILIDDPFMFDDEIIPPDLKYQVPFWRSNECDYTIYRKLDWPRIGEIDDILAGYSKKMRAEEECVLQYA